VLRSRKQLRERMKIPVFHDDQHGTAIIVGAAVLNGLELAGKKISEVKICTSGAGAAASPASTCSSRWAQAIENIWVADKDGLLTYKATTSTTNGAGRILPPGHRSATLAEVIDGADVFLGLSAGRAEARMLMKHGAQPADPGARQPQSRDHAGDWRAPLRPDAMICTGRSDFPQPGQQRPLLPLHLPRRARRAAPPRSTRR
jgi:malate dehydrogenase (oxaloacetate-decarboxylating)(NADP+)